MSETATNRVEKHKGVSLIVSEGWLTVVWDATGYQVAGPVENDADVIRIAKAAVSFLRKLSGE